MEPMSKVAVQPFASEADYIEEYDKLKDMTYKYREKMFRISRTAADDFIERCNQEMMAQVDEVQAEEERITKGIEENRALRKLVQKKTSELEEMKTQIKVNAKEKDAFLREREELELNVNSKKKELDEEKQLLASQSSQEEKESLEKSCQYFKERLGLQFKKISGGRMQAVFTLIDSKDQDRPFVFCVRTDGTSYTITDVEPPVSGIEELVDNLNKTNDFGSFVKCMRTSFKASLNV